MASLLVEVVVVVVVVGLEPIATAKGKTHETQTHTGAMLSNKNKLSRILCAGLYVRCAC